MSLLFPEKIRIGLGLSYAVLAKTKGAQVTEWKMECWDHAPSWQPALDAACGWLATTRSGPVRVSVVLSAAIAPLCLQPWRDDMQQANQQGLLTMARFREIYSEAKLQWKFSVDDTGFGEPWLASATDDALLKALNTEIEIAGGKLTSVQPCAVSVLNAVIRRIKLSGFWLLIPDQERLTVLYLQNHNPILVQCLPLQAVRQGSLREHLLREMRLAGLADDVKNIFMATSGKLDESLQGQFSRIDPGWRMDLPVASSAPLHLLGGA